MHNRVVIVELLEHDNTMKIEETIFVHWDASKTKIRSKERWIMKEIELEI